MNGSRDRATESRGTRARALGTRGSSDRGTDARREPSRRRHAARRLPTTADLVGRSGNTWVIRFDAPAQLQEAVTILFRGNSVPSGVALAPYSFDQREWTLSWSRNPQEIASAFTPVLSRIVGQMIVASVIRLTPEQTAAEHRRQEAALNFRPDFLGMTVREAFQQLAPGGHEINGYFVYAGQDPAYRGAVLQWYPVSKSNETFNKDIRWYLENGYTLREAVQQFDEQWMAIFRQVLGTFALQLAGAPRLGPGFRPNLATPTPTSIAETAFEAYTAISTIRDTIAQEAARKREESEERELQDEAATVSALFQSSVGPALAPIAGVLLTKAQIGALGERLVRWILERRGYTVFSLQNASGQGIDLVAVKEFPSSDGSKRTLTLYVEVKTTGSKQPTRLSMAQSNVTTFVTSRLEDMANRRGRYKNFPQPDAARAGALLERIKKSGAPIGGVVFALDIDLKPPRIAVRVGRWLRTGVGWRTRAPSVDVGPDPGLGPRRPRR